MARRHRLVALAALLISASAVGAYASTSGPLLLGHATREALALESTVELVRFVLFDEETRRVYEQALRAAEQ